MRLKIFLVLGLLLVSLFVLPFATFAAEEVPFSDYVTIDCNPGDTNYAFSNGSFKVVFHNGDQSQSSPRLYFGTVDVPLAAGWHLSFEQLQLAVAGANAYFSLRGPDDSNLINVNFTNSDFEPFEWDFADYPTALKLRLSVSDINHVNYIYFTSSSVAPDPLTDNVLTMVGDIASSLFTVDDDDPGLGQQVVAWVVDTPVVLIPCVLFVCVALVGAIRKITKGV